MIKLFVDDNRPAPEGWHLARTNTEAIRILATQEVSEVSLDHDISHKITADGVTRPYPCAETYEAVAYFIARFTAVGKACFLVKGIKGEPSPGKIIYADSIKALAPTNLIVRIHTANVTAGMRMKQILEEAGIVPILEIGKYGQANGLEVK